MQMKILHRVAAGSAGAILVLAGLTAPAPAASQQTSVIYTSLSPNPLHGNLPSVGAEAYAFNEFGNEVTFSGTNRKLTNVVVTMSTWGCVTGNWYSGDCFTPAGATFSEPITLNVYDATGGSTGPGNLIGTVTQSFDIPYRPSASAQCTGPNAGKWFDSSLKDCFNGLAINLTFNLGNVTAPSTIVYGIAYNTSHYGYNPITSATCPEGGCGYDSLNIALTPTTASHPAGSDTNPGTVWQNAAPSEYCDATAGAGTGLRMDSPTSACWTYVPAVQFKAGGGNR